METSQGGNPPMMSRIGAQMPGNYGQILHQTEQEQHQPANNPQWASQQPNEGMQTQQYYQQPQGYGQQQQQQQPSYYQQQPTQGFSHGQGGVPTYEPNVLPPAPAQGQRQVNFDNMPPWAGMPGCAAAFDAGGPQPGEQGGYSVVGQPPQGQVGGAGVSNMFGPQATPQSGKLMTVWKQYKDVIIVILIVYLLLKYAVPQAKRVLPGMFGNFETSLPATALFALSVGGVYQGSKRVI